MKTLIQKIIAQLASGILKRQRPDVIAITGSVGKTSTRQAVATVLASAHSVRTATQNLNNEFGVPLTIIGCTSPGRNPFGWLWIILKATAYCVLPLKYPDILVLEMGADHPGDIKYLVNLAKPHIGIVTMIGDEPVHAEFFKDVDHVAQEKFQMYKCLHKTDWAIVNLDEPRTAPIQSSIKAQPLTISLHQPADFYVREIRYSTNPRLIADGATTAGLSFKLLHGGSVVPCFIPGAVGSAQVYAALFAAAVGTIYGMNLVDITAALQHYTPPAGRMRLLAGQNNTVIIDDTYNASPAAMREALTVLASMETGGLRIACLGTMAELGKYSNKAHQAMGEYTTSLGIDRLITVGDTAKIIAETAVAYGFDRANVRSVADADAASAQLQRWLTPTSVVLVKGSQSTRLEKVVKAVMAEPEQAKQLLVRQYGKWI